MGPVSWDVSGPISCISAGYGHAQAADPTEVMVDDRGLHQFASRYAGVPAIPAYGDQDENIALDTARLHVQLDRSRHRTVPGTSLYGGQPLNFSAACGGSSRRSGDEPAIELTVARLDPLPITSIPTKRTEASPQLSPASRTGALIAGFLGVSIAGGVPVVAVIRLLGRNTATARYVHSASALAGARSGTGLPTFTTPRKEPRHRT